MCKVCEVTKPASEYYAGMRSKCKECHKAAMRKHRDDNIEAKRAYDRRRFQEDPHRRAYTLAACARRQKENPDAAAAIKAAWSDRNPEKKRANTAVGNAVRDGRIDKPAVCSSCGCGGVIHGHHDDYAKPLDVMWLCPACHMRRHREVRDAARASQGEVTT